MAQRLKTDWILFFTIVAMVVFGLTIVTSASSVMAELKYKATWYFVARQAAWAVVSFFVLMYFKGRDYRRLFSPVWAFAPLGIVLALLLVVWFADPRRHRWLNIATVGIQPSEFAKPALIIVAAPAKLLRHGQGGNHMSACAAACHHKLHPECSLTLSSRPSDVRVLSSELPP